MQAFTQLQAIQAATEALKEAKELRKAAITGTSSTSGAGRGSVEVCGLLLKCLRADPQSVEARLLLAQLLRSSATTQEDLGKVWAYLHHNSQ